MKTSWIYGLVTVSAFMTFCGQAQDVDTPLQSIPVFLNTSNIQANSVEEAGQMLQVIEALPTLSVTNQPRNGMAGTYWSAANLNFPPMPGNLQGLNAWPLDDTSNTFLLNDFEYEAEHSMMRMLDMGPPSPDDGDTNSSRGGNYTPGVSGIPYTNGLWLEMVSADPTANGLVSLILHGTTNDEAYEIFSRGDLLDTNWFSETNILGAINQNWTPFSVAESNRTNAFFWARSLIDSDGNGLPDYWETDNGVTDPYGDPDGDGWNNLQEYQNGTNPNQFDSPPAIEGFTFANSNNAVVFTWNKQPGTVTGYTLTEYDLDGSSHSFNLPADATSFDDLNPPALPPVAETSLYRSPYFTLAAHYSAPNPAPHLTANNSTIDVTADTDLFAPNSSLDATIVRGRQGHPQIVVSAMPANALAIRLLVGAADSDGSYEYSSNDIPVSSFTNGIYEIPLSWLPDQYFYATRWYLELVDTNGRHGSPSGDDHIYMLAKSFYDGREHMKQNLIFALRASDSQLSFSCGFSSAFRDALYSTYVNFAGYGGFHYPENYAYAGLNQIQNNYSIPDDFQPFYENYFFRNFAFSTDAIDDDGLITTGATWDYWGNPVLGYPLSYIFFVPTNDVAIPLALSANNSRWTYFPDDYLVDFLPARGIGDLGDNYVLTNDFRNIYGLKFLSVLNAYGSDNGDIQELDAGHTIPEQGGYFYPETEQPELQTTNHYFGRTGEDPLPGNASFSPTNTTPLMFTSSTIGSDYGWFALRVAAYAKQVIANGYSDSYGYLGLYFDKAYKVADNGTVTPNETGVLSPYGEFLPTEPGTVAMVTMPENADNTGPRGTNIVHVIKLQLDVNHDGVMDPSLSGPDNTSEGRPFTFWINDDSDWNSHGYDPIGQDIEVSLAHPADYTTARMNSQRDLEDWARIWICGMPALTNSGYQVTLSMSAQNGSPAINLVDAVETNGGSLYLTDTNAAVAQLLPGGWYRLKYPTISPGNSLTLPADLFTNAGNKYFLFEGAQAGKGELTLTVTKDGQAVAGTSTWIDLHEVKDFYEQAEATNVPSDKPPSDLVSDFSVIKTAPQAQGETKQIIVFVHGINNTASDYESTGRTIYKRLYWSGYHGRFSTFRWPCAYLPPNTLNPYHFNQGEFYAWKSGTAFKNYLSYLNNRPDLANYQIDIYAHSQGNVVASEAILGGAPFDNYILTQGAIPAHCYDTNAVFLQKLLDAEASSPTPFDVIDGGYHGYFSGIHGNLVNFNNVNDYALTSGTTLGLQTNWEEDQRAEKPEKFFFGQEYHYNPATKTITANYDVSFYVVTDLQEAKSMVARSRSRAVGAQGGLHRTISASVDLSGTFGFGQTRDEHSAQFDRPIQTAWSYYDEVLTRFGIQPIVR